HGYTLSSQNAIKLADGVLFSVAVPFVQRPTLFPYTTLFRSITVSGGVFTQNSEAITGTEVVVGAAGGVNFAGAGACTIKMVTESDRKSTHMNSSHHVISYAVLNKHTNVKASASFTNAGTITL